MRNCYGTGAAACVWRATLFLGIALTAAPALPFVKQVGAAEQFLPVLMYRSGPAAPGGSGLAGGYMDYLTLINKRDGGVGGVRLTWERCETAFQVERGLRCYQRMKARGGILHPVSQSLADHLLARTTIDRIPIITLGYGRAITGDGRKFPWVFPLYGTSWSNTSTALSFIAQRQDSSASLRGLSIVDLSVESPAGAEVLALLDRRARHDGFRLHHIALRRPGLDQARPWREIAQHIKPDYVLLRSWGVMTSVALREAARVGFDRRRIVGGWWAGSEEDVIPAGRAAKGYVAAAFHPSGRELAVIAEILRHVYGGLAGNISPQRVGSTYYNRGVIAAIVTVEAIRTAQAQFGQRVLNGDELRWGIENLDLTTGRLRELGAEELMPPLSVSCTDHEGGSQVRYRRWDGERWIDTSGWFQPDRSGRATVIQDTVDDLPNVGGSRVGRGSIARC